MHIFRVFSLVLSSLAQKKVSFASDRPAISKTCRVSSYSYLYTCRVFLQEQTWDILSTHVTLCHIKKLLCTKHKKPAEIPQVSQPCEPRLAAKYLKVEGSSTSKRDRKHITQLQSLALDAFGHEFNRT